MVVNINNHYYDVLIIGGGGSGLAAAIFAHKKNLKAAIISKVHPLKSHTVAAQGGINAALGNIKVDDWRWHAYDTIKASDWLADQDSVEIMCKSASKMIYMLKDLGVEFDLNEDGLIDQKIYGGQSTHFGAGDLAYRACYSKDRTGHSIMHTLYEKATSLGIDFYNYHFVLDLLHMDNTCYGVATWDIENGSIHLLQSKNTIIATGGYSQIFATATSSNICTGDGNGLIARINGSLQDMEFVQFHPTALNKIGILITEAARSAGGILLNSNKEPFMSQYAPKFKDLAARDVVSRAIATEINEGRGVGVNKDHVWLDLTHLSKEEIKQNLPTIFENCQEFINIDPSIDLIPIAPAAHYTMGGIPTDSNCQVIKYNENGETKIESLFAIGEAACISVHGAGRLGCNSLLDLIVFADVVVNNLQNKGRKIDVSIFEKEIINKLQNILDKNPADVELLRDNLKDIMSKNVGVFKSKENLVIALDKINQINQQFLKAGISDKSLQWNVELQHYLELENMITSATATIKSALWRQESRGAHWRNDFPEANELYHAHSIFNMNSNIFKRKVRKILQHVDFYQPHKRNY